MKTTTRIERIAELNAKIAALKATHNELIVRGMAKQAKTYAAKIQSKTQDRDELELSLYEDHGVVVG